MPKSKIDETLKHFAETLSGDRSKTPSSAELVPPSLGKPDCPLCHGIGYLRKDVPVSHPDFGRLEICQCRREQVSRQVRMSLYSLSHLDELRGLTFETFQVSGRAGLSDRQVASLGAIRDIAMNYAANLEGWMLLQGGYGCGKTHLAAAVANHAVSTGVSTLFLTVPDLLDTLRFAFDSEETTFEARFEEIRNAPFLVLDDFGTQNATGWAQEKLFQIINYRYINRLPLLVTTNLAMDEIEARIRSRLSDSRLVNAVYIDVPDHRHSQDEVIHSELSSLGLHAGQTFESFEDRRDQALPADEIRSLEQAVKAARAFAVRPNGWLVLSGPYGCGKTHLAAAIANTLAKKGSPPLFIMAPDLLDHLRATFDPKSTARYDHRFDEVRSAPVLFLDDLGTQATTPWAVEKFHQIFNHRYAAKLPTVMTLASSKYNSLDDQLLRRLEDETLCKTCIITAPAYHSEKKKRRQAGK